MYVYIYICIAYVYIYIRTHTLTHHPTETLVECSGLLFIILTARPLVLPGDLQGRSRHVDDDDDDDDDD